MIRQIGKCAEDEACAFLKAQGCKKLEQNYYCVMGEIDLIMQDKKNIVFVEVRYRKNNTYGSAIETITKSKIKKIIKTATFYLQKNKWFRKMDPRFDIIAINTIDGKNEINWYKNAFMVEST